MGGAVNTPWDVLMYILIFGGVPALIAGIPLAIIGVLGWRIQKRLAAKDDRVLPPSDKR